MHAQATHVATPSLTTGLRCHWIATEDEKGTHLIAHSSYQHAEDSEAAICAAPLMAQREGETCWHTTLYFVWDSH